MNRQPGDEHRYDDIIGLPHHQSSKHPHMSLLARAAQFAPFAALTGHKEAILETERLTDRRPELDENEKAILNEKMQIIQNRLPERETVEFIFFQPDDIKSGGSLVPVKGIIKTIDLYARTVIFESGKKIPMDDIVEIHLPIEPD